MALSVKNGWIDELNRVFIYFKVSDAMEFMNIGKGKCIKLFAELDSEKGCGLIVRKNQTSGSPVIRHQEVGETDSNNIEINNNKCNYTDVSDTYPIISNLCRYIETGRGMNEAMREREKYRDIVRLNIECDCLKQSYDEDLVDGVVEIMVDAICSRRDYLVINGDELPQDTVKCRCLKLDYSHISSMLLIS